MFGQTLCLRGEKTQLIIFHIAGLMNYSSKPDPNP